MVASYSPFELPVCLVGKFTLDGQGAQMIGKKKDPGEVDFRLLLVSHLLVTSDIF